MLLRFGLRKCEADVFRSLYIIMCGAEKLPVSLAQDFAQKFGVQPMEGYGCTELSPAVVINMPDRDFQGYRVIRNHPGTIGEPMPGIAAKVVHPEPYPALNTDEQPPALFYAPV